MNNHTENAKKTKPEAKEAGMAIPDARGRAGRARRKGPSTKQVYDDVATAAPKLGVDPNALRARLRRSQRDDGGKVVAELGGGIRAFKFGRSWRIRFPAE